MQFQLLDINDGMLFNSHKPSMGQGHIIANPADIPLVDLNKWASKPLENKCYNFACNLNAPHLLEPGDLGVEDVSVSLSGIEEDFWDDHYPQQKYGKSVARKLVADGHVFAGNSEPKPLSGHFVIAAFTSRKMTLDNDDLAGPDDEPLYESSSSSGGMVSVKVKTRVKCAWIKGLFHFYAQKKLEDVNGVKLVWAQKAGEQYPEIVDNIFEDAERQGYLRFAGFWYVNKSRMEEAQLQYSRLDC